jgi:hypothetical protein
VKPNLRSIFAFFAAAIVAGAQPHVSVRDPSPDLKQFIEISRSGEPAFDGVIGKLRGKNQTSPVDPLLPYSITIANISKRPLLGITVRFELEDARGSANEFIANVDMNLERPPVLRPGASRLYSPLKEANRAAVSPRGLARLSAPELNKKLAEIAGKQNVTISVDSVITNEGVIFGPDKFDQFHRLVAERQAIEWMSGKLEYSQAASVRLVAPGDQAPANSQLTGDRLLEELRRLASADVPKNPRTPDEYLPVALRSEADHVLGSVGFGQGVYTKNRYLTERSQTVPVRRP